jgi:hypothetical protein
MPEPERAEAIRSTLVPREGKPENVAQAMLFFVERLPPGGRRPYHLRGGQLNG